MFVITGQVLGLFLISFAALAENSFARQLTPIATPDGVRLVRASFLPAYPKAGEEITVFLSIEEFSSPAQVRTYAEAALDGAALALFHPVSGSWVAQFGPYSSEGVHKLSISVFVEDEARAQGLRQAIIVANQEMLRLQGEIAAERDPVRRAAREQEMLS